MIVVRLINQEATAHLVKAAPTGFVDVDHNSWYAGYVLVFKHWVEMMGFTASVSESTFSPNSLQTMAELIALVCKSTGVHPEKDLEWPWNYYSAAEKNGVISADMAVHFVDSLDDLATRGDAFAILHWAGRHVETLDGKTLFQRFHDDEAPHLQLNDVPRGTQASHVEISGRAIDAHTRVVDIHVNFEPVAFEATGDFTVRVPLSIGENVIIIQDADLVSNTVSRLVTVERIR